MNALSTIILVMTNYMLSVYDLAKRFKQCRLWFYLVSYPYFLNFSFICCLLLFQSLTQLRTNLKAKLCYQIIYKCTFSPR